MVVVVVEPILLDEVCHDHTGAHDHHGRTVLLKLAFLATPGLAPLLGLSWKMEIHRPEDLRLVFQASAPLRVDICFDPILYFS